MTERPLPPNAVLIPEEAKKVFEGIIFDVYHWDQKMFDGSIASFEMLKRPDSVVILAIDDGKIVVVQEEQPGGIVRRNSLPKGRVDPSDETILAAAQREMREETGMEFKDWYLLQITQIESKIEWFVYVYVAQNKTVQHAPVLDPGENISVNLIGFDTLKRDTNRHLVPIKAFNEANSLEEFITGLY